ncbi:MAG: DUF1801 domain-containing protein [Patescibacteria group bacterium]
MQTFKTVDAYLKTLPKESAAILGKLRRIIQKASPEAVESISYEMPAFKLNKKPLVYFAAYKNHIGFYATPSGHSAFKKDLSKYKEGKGSVQFPLTEAIPYDLIERMVHFRVKESSKK